MNNTLHAVTVAAIAFSSAGLVTQASNSGSSQAATPVARITVIGCVEPADQTTPTSDSKYKLSHAESGKRDSSQATGTSGSTSQVSTASTYRLDNGHNSTLAQDVGDQVEIVAVVDPEAATPPRTSGSNTTAAKDPMLKVETIRVISTSCPR
jgi:hypothetical protein